MRQKRSLLIIFLLLSLSILSLACTVTRKEPAADVEQDAVGRIFRDERRVALAPIRDGGQQFCIGAGIFGNGVEVGIHHAVAVEAIHRRADDLVRG